MKLPYIKTELHGGRLLMLLALIVLIFYPLGKMVLTSFVTDAGFSMDHYRRFFDFDNNAQLQALWGSLWISTASTLGAALIGIPLAFLFEWYALPAKRLLSVLATLPIVLPPLVGVVAFVFLIGESGILPRSLQALFNLPEPPFYLQGIGAVLVVHAYSFYVYFFLFTRAAFQRLDGATIEAARSLGAGTGRVIREIVLPQLRPAIAAAAVLVFMVSMASFSAPYLFGGDYRVLTVEIYNAKLQGDLPMAVTQSVMLALISLLFLFLTLRGEKRIGSGSQKGSGVRPREITGFGPRLLAGVLATVASLILVMPHLTLVLLSFVKNATWTSQILPDTFTWMNYQALFTDSRAAEPVLNSARMALLATAGNVAFAVIVAYWNVQRPGVLGRASEILIMLPWAIPGTVVAIALIVTFNEPHWFTGGAVLVGSFWILPLAYFIRHLPVVYRAGHAAFLRFERAQEEAAYSLGAGSVLTFRRVIFPAVRPGIVAGALLAAVMALGEFVSSILLYTFSNRPLSMAILNEIRLLNLGSAAAYGVMLTIMIFLITWLANRWGEL